MTYDAVKDELTYNGNLVRWFEDYYPISNNETAGIDFLNENGTVDVYAVRDLESFSKAADGSVDPAGKLIGLKEFTQQEFDARDIEALKNSTSVAMAGTPLEDSETAKLVAEYEAFGVTYDAEKISGISMVRKSAISGMFSLLMVKASPAENSEAK